MGGRKLSKYLPPKKIQEKKVSFLSHKSKKLVILNFVPVQLC
jgi:hypothetical protein